jgi:hypothetical protein
VYPYPLTLNYTTVDSRPWTLDYGLWTLY